MKGNEHIKSILSQSVVDSLDDFLNTESDTEYTGNYTGIVVDNKDPDKVGKCKIRVLGVHSDNIRDRDLPWAFPDFGFRGGLKGSFIVPPVDCEVNVYFERGELYIPRYSAKVINESKLPKNKNKNYPDNMIFFETDNGDVFEINRKKKETLFEHASGTKIFIDNGKIEIEHTGGTKMTIDNKKFEVDHKSGSKIVMDMMGNIKVTQSPTGTVSLGNNATIPCPDLTQCPLMGSPLAILTNVPGTAVKIP